MTMVIHDLEQLQAVEAAVEPKGGVAINVLSIESLALGVNDSLSVTSIEALATFVPGAAVSGTKVFIQLQAQ